MLYIPLVDGFSMLAIAIPTRTLRLVVKKRREVRATYLVLPVQLPRDPRDNSGVSETKMHELFARFRSPPASPPECLDGSRHGSRRPLPVLRPSDVMKLAGAYPLKMRRTRKQAVENAVRAFQNMLRAR